ncbi:hypothetical protein OOT46_00185 [Aquabacterium sp. A7-Y]|uniref:DUF6794 domain-containing protein n=1 Tax=Aquabacterium sp. A7-Y TaxID=1349605 RepID=UPI00223D40E6|nr:DUF6794 domain-containing protein [Aquabacterium sp. A7-Y]MCW7536271.1 hypothetical protein [Aquabacterium sp. A7-Y]
MGKTDRSGPTIMAGILLSFLRELDAALSEHETADLRALKEEDLLSLHFGLGLHIRNTFIHPATSRLGNLLRDECMDPDSASTWLTRLYRDHVQGYPLTMDRLAMVLQQAFGHLRDDEVAQLADRLLRTDTDP